MQSVYSNLRLPIELWAKVFINVSSPLDLASLSAVCADLHIEAERCLYHTVSVTSSQGFLRFAQAVAVSSRRAATVKSLRVDATHVFPESSCVAALRHLQLLESLDIRTHVTGVPDLAALADLCFPCLRVFAWRMPSDGAHVFAFLTHHRDSLEQLTIEDSARRRPAPARLATLPHLRALAGPYSATNHIDAANLTHLDLDRYPIIGLPILAERFGATLVALRLADPEFVAMNEPLWTLGDLATKFSRLRCLALRALGSDVRACACARCFPACAAPDADRFSPSGRLVHVRLSRVRLGRRAEMRGRVP